MVMLLPMPTEPFSVIVRRFVPELEPPLKRDNRLLLAWRIPPVQEFPFLNFSSAVVPLALWTDNFSVVVSRPPTVVSPLTSSSPEEPCVSVDDPVRPPAESQSAIVFAAPEPESPLIGAGSQ